MKLKQNLEERLANIERKLDIQAQEAKNILTLEEVAEYTHLSKSYVYKLTSKGDIPYYKPNGKQLYFKRTEIDEWLLTNRNKTNQEIEREIEREIATKSVLAQKRF